MGPEHLSLVGLVVALALAVGPSAGPPTLFPCSASTRQLMHRETFDRSDLFDFIDGGAEVYLAYGFQRVWVSYYRGPDRPEIAAEAYDMGTSDDAYGVLSVDPTGEHVAVGSLARYGAGLLRFCKGRWFVRVLAERETAETRAAVLDLGRRIAEAIPDQAPAPQLLALLPSEGLLPDSATYFHTQMTLNQLYYLSQENWLGLSPETEAVLADYSVAGGEARLLVVRYPTTARRRAAWKAFTNRYLEVADAQERRVVGQVEGGQFVAVHSADLHLVCVFEAAEASAAAALLDSAVARISGGAEDD